MKTGKLYLSLTSIKTNLSKATLCNQLLVFEIGEHDGRNGSQDGRRSCAARQHEQGSQRIECRVVERFREDSLAGRRAIPGD
jgi:hypothetical protein